MRRPSSAPESFTFKATLGRTWLLYTVDVPERVSRALGPGKIPVVFTVSGSSPRKTTLAPKAGGGHRLHVHGEARREVGSPGEGDRVTIELRRDLDPVGPEPPPDLADALREMDVLDTFRTMGPAMQRELVAYVEKAKREETRRKYVARVVERACAERERRLDRKQRRH